MSDDSSDLTICFCHSVPRSRLVKEIQEGAETLAEIQKRTQASTGCGGCEFEVLELLQEIRRTDKP